MPAPVVELVDELAATSGVVAVVLGGSHAVGADDTDSDWDLLCWVDQIAGLLQASGVRPTAEMR
jgi:predicted nucleotidyltransferase